MKSELITYDRVFELPLAMLNRGPATRDADCVLYAVLLTTSELRPRIEMRSIQHRLSQDLDYESYGINTRSCIDTVAVPFSTEIAAKDALTRINKWAATDYPDATENLVSQFCEDIDACKEGHEFASKYGTLADLWDGMVDSGESEYLNFVIGRLEDSQPLRMRYITNPNSWSAVSLAGALTAAQYREQVGLRGRNIWFETFTSDYLKSINPFRK